MPELPDLEYIVKKINTSLPNRSIKRVSVKEPIVIRMLIPKSFPEALGGERFGSVSRRGPFLRFQLVNVEMIAHLMLAGRFQLAGESARPLRHLCFSLYLDSGEVLRLADEKRMAKVYLVEPGSYEQIPGFLGQGLDIIKPGFTFENFKGLIERSRQQARVFLLDQAKLSAIGNAYADEILFAAGIHPRTRCNRLDSSEMERLFTGIREVIQWGIEEVEKAGEAIEVKVRNHLRVRNRKGRPCPTCGTEIRRTGVLGFDSFFCPHCQPARGKQFIPWS